MKAWEVQGGFGIESLTLVDRPEPKAGPGQVLMKLSAWSLNYRDLMVVKGQYNPKIRLPFTPFSDGVGTVAAVGDGVTRVKAGDRVAGCFLQRWLDGPLDDAKGKSALGGGQLGMLAEQVVLHEDGVVPVPAHLSDVEAATLPCAAVTAWNALVSSSSLKAGDTVLIQGTGGVSLFALQIARLHGARVIATSSKADKLARVLHMGASDGINYKDTPEWGDKVRELTGGAGVDQVIEVGGAGTLGQSLKAVRTAGTISLIGVLAGVGQVNPVPVLMKNVRVQGIFVGSRAMFEAMNRAFGLAKLKPVVDKSFAFAEAREALKYMESAAHFGKICIHM
ncbi:MAG: NAD(P)-dependent alcohol dehydrogenase [Gemmataceae bacterium]|nr:NAD(P)-dependent alcohol dehydrogenase [Gemmataceae bacterium]